MSARVVIAHRSTFVRDVVRCMGAERALVVVGETSRAGDLAALCESEHPDVVLAEADFGDGTEIESVLPELRATGARAVVVCADPSPERLTRILLLGASGYLHDDPSPEQVVEAVETVAGGGSVLGPSAATIILEQWRRLREPGAASGCGPPTLSARERDVLVAMADGLPAKSIARRLGVAVKTVENHKIRVFEKLGVHTQAHAVCVAINHGLLTEVAPEPGAAARVAPAAPAAPGAGALAGSDKA